ncbi:WecB/TagA/CpsF family glycosyltransferase [uncultured Peptoniphilus sp.]|uniref:WecB/TagA/CpsF family glycosyltransferase n=1 Tax=uncultured Peptoniphilus sp. TaxID=254354 RepID=UPI0028050F68|nr:WecB/TagA/CpsF family glycosyltransferase [uncultured Peptoniphilus sp.]
MNTISIFGVNICNIDFEENKKILNSFLKSEKLNKIYTPNTEIVMAAKNDEGLKALINKGDLILADGIGLIYASKMRKNPLKERVTGFDSSIELLKMANKDALKVYFLGGKEGIAKRAAENVKREYENLIICGYHNGYFKGAHTGDINSPEEEAIIRQINEKNPHIIFVGLGFPKQEIWIDKNYDRLKGKIIIGNGGVLDILAGAAKRAPEIFIKLNLEWFYRLITDPKRIKRQLAIPKFLLAVLFDKSSVK